MEDVAPAALRALIDNELTRGDSSVAARTRRRASSFEEDVMRRCLRTLIAVTAVAAAPLAVTPPAYAETSANGWFVNPEAPSFAGFNSAGDKLVDYSVWVRCSARHNVRVQEEQWEDDAGADQHTREDNFSVSGPADRRVHIIRVLPDTESGREEIDHRVRFSVTLEDVTSYLTGWERSATTSLAN